MLEEKELMTIATNEMIKIFGKQYLRENQEGTCMAAGFVTRETYQLFLGFKGAKELPERISNSKGWTVYGLVFVSAKTGEIIKKEYALE